MLPGGRRITGTVLCTAEDVPAGKGKPSRRRNDGDDDDDDDDNDWRDNGDDFEALFPMAEDAQMVRWRHDSTSATAARSSSILRGASPWG